MSNISVIVPVYNVEPFLRQCVDSILNQSFTDFELILVDDGSPDGCPAICDEYWDKDRRVAVIHQQNAGLSAARNSALDIASGEYIAFIDSDDYVTQDYLEHLYDFLISNHADVSTCDAISFEDGTEPVMNLSEVPEPIVMSGRDACFSIYKMDCIIGITAWGKLYRKQLFTDLRFPVGRINEDNALVPILIYNAVKIAVSKKKMYLYRQRAESIMGKPFSLKRFDEGWAIENCISYFKEKEDTELVKQASVMISVFNARIVLAAHKAGIPDCSIPEQYRMNRLTAWQILYLNLPGDKFEWYLAQYHPKLVLPFAYLKKSSRCLACKYDKTASFYSQY